MGVARRRRRRMVREGAAVAVGLISVIDGFSERGYLRVDAGRYFVVMLREFWDIYKGEKRNNFLSNLKFYCDIMNAYGGVAVDEEASLLISIKEGDGETDVRFCYKGGTVAVV